MTAQTSPYFDLSIAPHSVEHVELLVRNLDEMAAFYTQTLGLKVHAQDQKRIRLGTETQAILDLAADADVQRRNFRASGLFHVAFLLPNREDLGAWFHHAVRTGVELDGAAHHGVSEALYLSDPEGNGVEIYADRPRKEWQGPEGDVNITSKALKTSTLSNKPWAGMASRGRIGHVHLQAADLAASENFWTGLGFDIAAKGPGATFFGSGGYHHQIAANTWNSRKGQIRGEREAGLSQITLRAEAGPDQELVTPSEIVLKTQEEAAAKLR